MFRDNSFKLAMFTVLVFAAVVYFMLAPIASMDNSRPYERYFDQESGMYVFLSDNGIAVACPCSEVCGELAQGGPNPIVGETPPTREIADKPNPTSQPDAPNPTPRVEPTRQPDAPNPTRQPDAPTPTPDSDERQHCNRGIGNGSEDCDPGNSYGQGRGVGRRAGEDRHEKDRGKNK